MSPGELPRACGPQIRAFLLVHSASGPQVPGLPPEDLLSPMDLGARVWEEPPAFPNTPGRNVRVGGNCPRSLLQCPWDPRSARLRHPDETTDIDRVLVTAGLPLPVTGPSPPRAPGASHQDGLPVAGTLSGHTGPPWGEDGARPSRPGTALGTGTLWTVRPWPFSLPHLQALSQDHGRLRFPVFVGERRGVWTF